MQSQRRDAYHKVWTGDITYIALAIGAVMDINLSNEMTLRFTVIDISVVWNFSDISAVSKLLSYVDASTLRNSATVAQQLL